MLLAYITEDSAATACVFIGCGSMRVYNKFKIKGFGSSQDYLRDSDDVPFKLA